jgi:hypothetical protein
MEWALKFLWLIGAPDDAVNSREYFELSVDSVKTLKPPLMLFNKFGT